MRIGSLNQESSQGGQNIPESQNMKNYMASSETRKVVAGHNNDGKKDISLPYPGPVITG